jgi:hypothetical protein
MRSFGKSLAAGNVVYDFFDFESSKIAARTEALIEEVERNGIESLRGNFRDLNGGAMGLGFESQQREYISLSLQIVCKAQELTRAHQAQILTYDEREDA